MVYRLYRANRFLMTRIFIVLLIYSLIIGSLGFILLGVVYNFDAQSFNPRIYDANVQGAGSDPNVLPICDNYRGENCTWYMFNDLANRPFYDKYKPELESIRNRLDFNNLMMIQQKLTNATALMSAEAQILNTAYLNSTTSTGLNAVQEVPETCFLPQKGVAVDCSTVILDSTAKTGPSYQFIPNLNLIVNSTNVSYSYILASSVLVDTSPQHNILCTTWPGNCTYYATPEPFTYTYFGPTTKIIQKNTNVSAMQVYIKPNNQVWPNLQKISLSDVDTNGPVQIICQNDDNKSTNYCNDPNSPGPNYYEDYNTHHTFMFIDEQNNIIRPGIIQLASVTSFDPGIENIDLQNTIPSFICQTTDQIGLTDIMERISITCSPDAGTEGGGTVSFQKIESPLLIRENSNAPKLLFDMREDVLLAKTALLVSSTEGRSSLGILFNIVSKPSVFFHNYFNNDVTPSVVLISLLAFVINLLLAIMLILFRFWKRVGGWLGPKGTLMLRGKLGAVLELTQFFEFSGSWYLEAQSVNDYNFKGTLGVVHELVNERWRDTIFFPTSLAASISIVIFSVYAHFESLYSLFVLGGILPLLLAFWIPALWVIEDSGLKRAEWNSNGELLTIQKISAILRDGFNKLVGFGAIFGIGTAGASVARARITNSSVSTSSALTGGFENLLNLNFNFLVSAILWTTALLFIVTAISMSGNVITSLSYLNSDHLANVKKMRTKLQKKEIFLGTTQPSMEHANLDTSIYFDSKQGIDSAMSQQMSRRGQSLPDNTIIAKQAFVNEEDLTHIIIADPKDFEHEPEKSAHTASSEGPVEEISSTETGTEEDTQESSMPEPDTESESSADDSMQQESTEDESTSYDNDTSTADESESDSDSDSDYKKDE